MRRAPAKKRPRPTAAQLLERLRKDSDPLIRRWASKLELAKEMKSKTATN